MITTVSVLLLLDASHELNLNSPWHLLRNLMPLLNFV